jgi:pimeloyl-ACP methyl ester carboxylesterase
LKRDPRAASDGPGQVFAETLVTVSADPVVELFVAQSPGPRDHALLVIHGGPDWDHTYLREPLAQLGDRHRLVMPDLRGCGRSTAGLRDDQYTPDAVVADLVALLDVLGLGAISVLGFSYGGLLAQRLARARPDRISRLVIASSSIYPVPADAYAGWAERDTRIAPVADVWSNPALSGAELVRAAALAQAPADVWRADRLDGYLDRLAQVRFGGEWVRPWRAGTLPSALPADSERDLAGLGIPVLLLHGAQDMTFPGRLAARAAARLPAARAVILEDAGHMAHVDQPGRWLDALAAFLQR